MEMVMVPSSGVIIELDDDLTTNCMFVSIVFYKKITNLVQHEKRDSLPRSRAPSRLSTGCR